jgi:hypothetical protein
MRRRPDYLIGPKGDPYLERWWVIPRNRWLNVYLHHFRHSDDDRALHDHPYASASFILKGSYVEHTFDGEFTRFAGSVTFRSATVAHRIELRAGNCWTLFVTGPRIREWGFWCPKGWRHWRDFCALDDAGDAGPGCD